jgi:hypothetical protein
MAQPMNITDVNTGNTIAIDKTQVLALYELDLYRQIVMNSGQIYDATESFSTLSSAIGNAGGGNP